MKKTNVLNLSILSVSLSSILFSGCSSLSDFNISQNNVNSSKETVNSDKVVLNDEFINNNKLTAEEQIFKTKKEIIYKENYKLEDLIVEESFEGVPRSLVNKKINNISFNKKKLGSVINLLLEDVEKVSLRVGPNVDLNTNINIKIHDRNLYDALKTIAFSVGYHLYYDEVEKSIVISPNQKRTYRIPSGILIQKTAENELQGGATITLQPEDPYAVLEKGLKEAIGSKNKGVFIDRDSGLVIVKEHPAYIPEIDKYVLDFVLDRSRQFMLEAAIVEITHVNNEALGFDVKNLQTVVGDLPVFVNSVTGGAGFTGATISSNFVNQDVGLDSIITAINTKTTTNVVDRPRVIVFNHSVGFVNRGSERSYISGTEKIMSDTGNTSGIAQKVEKFEEGLKIAMRVDAMPSKDSIVLSLAPSLKNGRLEAVQGDESGAGVEKLMLETREIMTNANLKNGDIIVLGGVKNYTENKNLDQTPFLKSIPFVRDIFKNDSEKLQQIETLFLVKVKEIKETDESLEGSKLESLDLLRRSGE